MTDISANQKLILISGPTASGKTDLAMDLARDLPVDIISVDAAQVYRGMNIGTAKPDAQTLENFPHYLIDIRDPEESYSAADFQQDAVARIERSFASNRQPVLVGGSMFYFSALINGLSGLPASNQTIRAELKAEAEQLGLPALHQKLQIIDPELAERIRLTDPQRLMRALELARITGEKPSVLMQRCQPRPCPWPYLHFTLFDQDRRCLHLRIQQRYELMLHNGLIDEVRGLKQRPGLNANSTSMRTIGYRQVWSYLDSECSKEEMLDQAVAATRQLAKRQLTWIRNTSGIVWLDALFAGKKDLLLHFLKENRFPFVV
ncbi:MAG: tRNA dimethylallyltransferase [Parasphingorhabdus sp.]|jgi:tRNA dimethylallyltransferase